MPFRGGADSVSQHMRENYLDKQGFEQVPQLSSSRIIDVNERMNIVNDNPSGVKRAVLIGINYVGQQQGELSGCHNDVKNISSYLQEVQGFHPQNMITLMDDRVLYMANPNHYLTFSQEKGRCR